MSFPSTKIRNRTFYKNHYGIDDPLERRRSWQRHKRWFNRHFPARIEVDEWFAFRNYIGLVFLSNEAFEWLEENVYGGYHLNETALLLGFAHEDDALAFTIRFAA